MALYGKYRPQNFANLVGQDHIRQTILNEIQQNSLTHAYLFAGPRGTGKTSTARLIAKALNCEKKTTEGEPCDECGMCQSITEGSLIDVIEIDAASNRGIDEIRDLKEKIKFAPTRAKNKVYIIDEVHMLTKEAFNALLKTLEEPPENVFFILCTTEIHKIPETIISRCQKFDFRRIDVKTIMTRLNYIVQMEGIAAEDEAIELIAEHVEGSLRDAIGLLEQMKIDNKLSAQHVRSHMGITGHKTIETLIDLLKKRETERAIHLINEVHNEGYDLNSLVREIMECLRQKLISGIQKNCGDAEIWLNMITHFEEARDMMRNALIPQLPLEIAVIKICGAPAGILREAPVAGEKLTHAAEEKKAEKPLQNEPVQIQKEAASEEQTRAEEQTAQTIKQEYKLEKFKGDISASWPRVLEQIQPPSLRRSLLAAKVSEKGGSAVCLTFSSKFHMATVNSTENKVKVEKAIEKVTDKKVQAACELDENAKIKAPAEEKTAVQNGRKLTEEPAKTTGKKQFDLTAKALEIFGENE